jgi:hypothetical protein
MRIPNTVWNCIKIQEKEQIKGSVVDTDPDWTRIEWDPWVRIRIQEGKNNPQKLKKVNKFPFLKCCMFSFER